MNKQRGIAEGWLYLIGLVAIVGAFWGAVHALNAHDAAIDTKGHQRGVSDQKATDQLEFDRINRETAAQKAQANTMYRAAQDAIIVLQQQRDALKTQLEKQYADNQKIIDDLRAKYAGVGLRYLAPAQVAGSGNGGGLTQSTAADAPGLTAAAVLQLPGPLAASLRQLAFDADALRISYAKCYGYGTQVK